MNGKNRVVIVFGHAQDDRVVRQVAFLKSRPEALEDRHMVVLQLNGENVRTVHGNSAGLDADRLRRGSGVKTDSFRVVLVGKDGAPKLT